MIVFALSTLFILNVLLLVIGPLFAGAGVYLIHTKGKLHYSGYGWGRLPLSIALGLGLPFGVAFVILAVNPNVRSLRK